MTDRLPSIAPLQPGDRLDHIEILRPLARDGQAQVYLARVIATGQPSIERLLRRIEWFGADAALIKTQRLCVIKLALPSWDQNLRDEHSYLTLPAIKDYQQIVQILADIGDPTTDRNRRPRGLGFVNRPVSGGASVQLPFIVLTYEPGGSLKDLLDRRKRRPLPPPVAVAIARQIAQSLEYLHRTTGLVHHDMSPSNIVFRRRLSALWPSIPECVLIDLAVADSPLRPKLRRIYGRRTYLPPERLSKPPSPIDWTIDVYGLGVVLYEMLVGQLPRVDTNAVTNNPQPLPPIRSLQPRISTALEDLVMDAVSHRPAQRPTMQDLIDRLNSTPEAAQPGRLRGPGDARSLWQAAAGGLIALVVLVTLVSVALVNQPTSSVTPTPEVSEATLTPIPRITPTVSPTPSRVPTSTPALTSALP